MHSQYLRWMYLHNDLVKPGKIRLNDTPVFAGSVDGRLGLFRLNPMVRLASVPSKEDAVVCAASAQQSYFALGSKQGSIRLWDLNAKKEKASFQGHQGGITALSFSPDGRWLASASVDHEVKLWDVASGKENTIFRGWSIIGDGERRSHGQALGGCDRQGNGEVGGADRGANRGIVSRWQDVGCRQ